MKKMDGKEAELNEISQLSEEDLEGASGGAGNTYHSRWVCLECGFHGNWGSPSRVRDYEKTFHYNQTGHFNFGIESKVVADPSELPD